MDIECGVWCCCWDGSEQVWNEMVVEEEYKVEVEKEDVIVNFVHELI